ncbi:unnamed protein product [Caenorhabditis bovis]|uniref:Uncharacterized protein n=1 Tax=Caenorhabditis bovis TaxID=2654633 RepID=A0A8S1EE29_9PELO|nr:unnamed protein product [Caenorhabditis bovis]
MMILLHCLITSGVAALNNCPTAPIRSVIQRAAETTSDAVTQMQMIRRILEDIYGGTWGVLIIRNPTIVSKDVHWTFPDHSNSDGTPAFCLAVIKKWQYNVFKTGQVDSPQRMTIENMIQRFSSGTIPKFGKTSFKEKRRMMDIKAEKVPPRRYSVAELDRLLASAFSEKAHVRLNRSPRIVN